jgi:hypothetical protein
MCISCNGSQMNKDPKLQTVNIWFVAISKQFLNMQVKQTVRLHSES